MAKISHTKIKQPSFGEKRPKLTCTKISRFTVVVFVCFVLFVCFFFFLKFLDFEDHNVVDVLVRETNRYAKQHLTFYLVIKT
jgi:hypothetical protein